MGFKYLTRKKEQDWKHELAWYSLVATSGIGIVVHELGHKTAAEIFHIKVKRADLLSVGLDPFTMGGSIETEKNNNFVASLFISMAPMVSNATLILVLYGFYGFMDVFFKGLFIFLMISLFLGALPSGQDIIVVGETFKQNPMQGILTIGVLITTISLFFVFYGLLGALISLGICLPILIVSLIILSKKFEKPVNEEELESEENRGVGIFSEL